MTFYKLTNIIASCNKTSYPANIGKVRLFKNETKKLGVMETLGNIENSENNLLAANKFFSINFIFV